MSRDLDDITDVPGVSTSSPRRVFAWSAGIAFAVTFVVVYLGDIAVGQAMRNREVADRVAFVPIEGPGYVSRKLGYKSVADKSCYKLWSDPLKGFQTSLNGVRASMLCYSQTRQERLCDPKERAHFVKLIQEYVAYEALVQQQGMAPMLNLQMDAISASLEPGGGFEPADPFETLAVWRKLALEGFIARSDFPWLSHHLIEAAFVGIEPKPSPCSPAS
jgi:hypothetical protein